MIAAGGIAYLGAFTAAYRTAMEEEWSRRLVEYKVPLTRTLPCGC